MYLDNIVIYIKNLGQLHINLVYKILEQLQKYGFFANLKNYHFYKDKVWFLRFVVLVKSNSMKEEKIEVVKAWPEPKSIRDI